jgi:hypothetical protein
VEGSKLFFFSLIMPAKCVSSISPRFHYRRLAFCFLPLATILESPPHFHFWFFNLGLSPPHFSQISRDLLILFTFTKNQLLFC